MDNPHKVITKPSAIGSRLHELNVEADVLQEAIKYGVSYSSGCTAHDPPMMAGVSVWAKATRFLRDQLVPKGWKLDNSRNYATTVNVAQNYLIAVAAGDSMTGLPDNTPRTRTEKGPATREAVSHNQSHFSDISTDFGPRPTALTKTWLLLHYLDEDQDEIRIELSQPAYMTDEGYVCDWLERIILSPVPLTPVVDMGSSQNQAIDVPVRQRAAS